MFLKLNASDWKTRGRRQCNYTSHCGAGLTQKKGCGEWLVRLRPTPARRNTDRPRQFNRNNFLSTDFFSALRSAHHSKVRAERREHSPVRVPGFASPVSRMKPPDGSSRIA